MPWAIFHLLPESHFFIFFRWSAVIWSHLTCPGSHHSPCCKAHCHPTYLDSISFLCLSQLHSSFKIDLPFSFCWAPTIRQPELLQYKLVLCFLDIICILIWLQHLQIKVNSLTVLCMILMALEFTSISGGVLDNSDTQYTEKRYRLKCICALELAVVPGGPMNEWCPLTTWYIQDNGKDNPIAHKSIRSSKIVMLLTRCKTELFKALEPLAIPSMP